MAESQPQEAGLVLSGARLADGRTVDVRLCGARIEAVGTAGSLSGSGGRSGSGGSAGTGGDGGHGGSGAASGGSGEPDGMGGSVPPSASSAPTPPDGGSRVDLSGYLLLPAPAEPHGHYDSAFTAGAPAAHRPSGRAPGTSGPPLGSPEEVQRRTTEAALLQLAHGATASRTHVRIGDVVGLRSLEAVLQARRSLRGMVELDAVAVPRLLTGIAGADGLAMLRDALKMGATVVGGCPDLDPDPAGYVDAVLEVAAEQGCAVDLHTDGDDPARLSRLAAAAGGLRPGVAIGPCAGLARVPYEAAARVADRLAAAGVSVVCLPQGNCGALERPSPGAPSRMAPVRLLASAGVSVAAGSGALRDAANQVGRGDPLEAAYLLASFGERSPAAAYEAVATRSRALLGLPEVRVEAGFPAELLAVRGSELAGSLSLAYSRIVVHRGRVVARTSAVREYCGLAATTELGLPRQQSQD